MNGLYQKTITLSPKQLVVAVYFFQMRKLYSSFITSEEHNVGNIRLSKTLYQFLVEHLHYECSMGDRGNVVTFPQRVEEKSRKNKVKAIE